MPSAPRPATSRVAVACPDKFRGSLEATEAAAAFARGLEAVGVEVRQVPLADGGEGTLDALLRARGGRRHRVVVTGPLGDPVEAEYGVLPDGTVVVEMARASGLALVDGRNDPLAASTRGTGELMQAALRNGARRLIVAVGGSATTDGGLGAVEALGWSLRGADCLVACDVATSFVDAAREFAPQKGAGPSEVAFLTRRLEGTAEQYRRRTGIDVSGLAGSGAAGGLAGGLAALGARLAPGFGVVASAAGLDEYLEGAGLVVTGEGRLDAGSFSGKVVGEVLDRAGAAGVPRRAVICGSIDAEAVGLVPEGVRVEALVERAFDAEDALGRASVLATDAASAIGIWAFDRGAGEGD